MARVERVEFTKQMKSSYTILCPDMTPIHFAILQKLFKSYGYKLEVLKNTGSDVAQKGLKYVHNDTCYPALLVIGQMIDALDSGAYDLEKVALILPQTGGGCRASNYIFLLRKALQNAGYGQIPVISLNANGLEKNSGFKLGVSFLKRSAYLLVFGDLLMLLNNQTKPYEKNKGESEELVKKWIDNLGDTLAKGSKINKALLKEAMIKIVKSFEAIEKTVKDKTKVGVVGEIYVKFAALGNNNLEEFLQNEDCEVMVPGLLGFVMYCAENGIIDNKLYGKGFLQSFIMGKVNDYLTKLEMTMIRAIKEHSSYTAPSGFNHLKTLNKGVIGEGCKMGEGWLLPAEMVELVELGYNNIVCAQPFGCLPNHIVGKGVVANIKQLYPDANIVPIDYDPGASRVNQENRIKLMLSIAREKEITKSQIKSKTKFTKSIESINV